jgi:catechol 2,3-dioxygenase-like lactoylglutathione lyase family enzyme
VPAVVPADGPAGQPARGALHHLELWVADLDAVQPSWDWLLQSLGYRPHRSWPGGLSWVLGDGAGVYVVLEQSPAVLPGRHERTRPGWNHLALWAGSADELAALVVEAPRHGWRLLFADRHPFAGGPDHHAAYLEDGAGHEVELVASRASDSRTTQSPGTTSTGTGSSTNPSEA